MFTITNEASTQQLGSVQISAPAGSTITGASLFLNLSLAPGKSTTLTVSATMLSSSCSPGSTYQWGIKAKQSNDFNGSGNDFQLDPKSVQNLQGSCSLQPCPNTCSATAMSSTTVGTVTTSDAGPNDSIATGMEDATSPGSSFSFSCGTYRPVSDAFGFAVFDDQGKPKPAHLTVTLRIRKSLVNSSGHPGASSWQICYAAPQTVPPSFNAVPGTTGTVTIGGVTYDTGQLLDCSNTQPAPCVQARNKNNAGDVIVTFLALGDPYGRG